MYSYFIYRLFTEDPCIYWQICLNFNHLLNHLSFICVFFSYFVLKWFFINDLKKTIWLIRLLPTKAKPAPRMAEWRVANSLSPSWHQWMLNQPDPKPISRFIFVETRNGIRCVWGQLFKRSLKSQKDDRKGKQETQISSWKELERNFWQWGMIMEIDMIMIMEDLFIVLTFLKNYKHYNFL